MKVGEFFNQDIYEYFRVSHCNHRGITEPWSVKQATCDVQNERKETSDIYYFFCDLENWETEKLLAPYSE